MEKVINCPCGFVLRGKDDDEVVQKAQEHAKSVHGMDLSREQALEMAFLMARQMMPRTASDSFRSR